MHTSRNLFFKNSDSVDFELSRNLSRTLVNRPISLNSPLVFQRKENGHNSHHMGSRESMILSGARLCFNVVENLKKSSFSHCTKK